MPAILNGRLPDALLITVGTDHYGRPARFQPQAAASWARMRAAGMPFDVSDTYRDYARQKAYEKNPPNGAGLAAPAGTSVHGWGLAVDARGGCLAWLTARGAGYGWLRTIKREAWHFEYRAENDQHRTATHAAPAAEEDDMPYSPDDLKALMRSVRDEEGGDTHSALVKLARQDPQVVLFRTTDGRKGVAWPGRGYAIAPDDDTAQGFIDVLGLVGRPSGSLAVAAWSKVTRGDDVVHNPEKFGPRFPWERYTPTA